jgi:hypothetical protein
MYCVGCGSTLQNEFQFCPRCGKRSVLDETTSDTDLPEAPANTEINTNGKGKAFEPELSPPTEISTNAVAQTVSTQSAAGNSKVANRYVNVGSITLGVIGVSCLILGAVQGFIPIFLIEGVAFGALAWLCAARWPLSPHAFSAVFVSSLLLAGLVGVTLDQDTFGPRYHYLSQGSTQYRIDEKAGRTDRLGSGGWHPVAFDKAPEELPTSEVSVFDFSLKDGHWGPNWPNGDEICFTFENSFGYIIQKIPVLIEVKDRDGKEVKDVSRSIDLKKEDGGLIDTGETTKVCAHAPGNFPEGGSWSSSTSYLIQGWKR